MNILGINAYHGDVSAALLMDGQLVAAIEEERFRRVKHWAGFPRDAIRSCLQAGGLSPRDVDIYAVSRKPAAHLHRKVLFLLARRPNLRLITNRAGNVRRVVDIASRLAAEVGEDVSVVRRKLRSVEHHPAHLASTFFASPFEDAAVCSIDAFGDFVSTSWAAGRGSHLDVIHRTYFPHSLGQLYLAITQYLGFSTYGDEFKVMGLAPYGRPDFADAIRRLVTLRPGGRFRMDLSYFTYWSSGDRMTWDDGAPTVGPVFSPKLEELLGPARRPGEPLTPRHEAIAASLQVVFEEAVFHVLKGLFAATRNPRVCLSGGCAMNSVANGKIRERTPFTEVYIQPAAADNGTSLGAALYTWHQMLGKPRSLVMTHGYWGPAFDEHAIEAAIEARREQIARDSVIHEMPDADALCRWTAGQLASGRIVGWFQGRMEWGARALGNRSILADARRADMRDIINSRIKFREKFRPFAPSVLEEAADQYFVDPRPDPFMIQTRPVRDDKRAVIPAVTHVDGSGRLQTVSRNANPLYWSLIKAFEQLTGVPVVLNTSFNENEPIVLTPAEALDCFLRTRMDVLVLGRTVIEKNEASS